MANEEDEIQIPKPADIDAMAADFQVEKQGATPPTAEERASNPMSREEYAFVVKVTNGDGSTFEGAFTNKILSPKEQIDVGVFASRLVYGTAWAVLDPQTAYVAGMISHLTTSLVKKPEKWKVSSTKNTAILERIYEEVVAHERYFRGPGKVEG